MDEDRSDCIEAALVFLRGVGIPNDSFAFAESMLRLGFAIGTAKVPSDLVPPVCLTRALEAKEEAKKFREQQREFVNEDNVTGVFAQLGRRRVW